MSLKLYELDEALSRLDFDVDEETGEIQITDMLTGEVLSTEDYENLRLEREKKIEALGVWIKSLDAEWKALKEEADNLALRMKRLLRKKESLLEWMKRELNGEKFSTPKVNCVWRRSESVNVIDDNLIPDKYCNIQVQRKPDKKMIKDAIKKGEEVKGAILEENRNLTVK